MQSESGYGNVGQGFSRGAYSVRSDLVPNALRRCVKGSDGRWWPKPEPERGDFLSVVLDTKSGTDDIPEGGILAVLPSRGDTALANARLFSAAPALYEYVRRWAAAGDDEAGRLLRLADEGLLYYEGSELPPIGDGASGGSAGGS